MQHVCGGGGGVSIFVYLASVFAEITGEIPARANIMFYAGPQVHL